MKYPCFLLIALLALAQVAAGALPAVTAEAARWHSGDNSPSCRIANAQPGELQITYSRADETAWPEARITFDPALNLEGVAALQLRVKVDNSGVAAPYLALRDPEWRQEITPLRALNADQPLPPGEWLELTLPLPANKNRQLRQLAIGCDLAAIPDGGAMIVSISSPIFLAKLPAAEVPADFSAKQQAWENFLANYEPDYRDGTYLLAPPEEGRLKTALPLARDGQPQAEIVVPPDADPCLRFAAKELALWLGKVTQAEFPIVTAPVNPTATQLILQTAELPQKYRQELANLGDGDGFAIRADGNRVYLFGPQSKSVLNAVYAFLEGNTDIIWPRPKAEFEAVYTVTANLDAVWGDISSQPQSRLRGWGTNYGRNSGDELWMARNRCNYFLGGGGFDPSWTAPRKEMGSYSEYGGGHNLFQYLGDAVYAEHPEYFAFLNGKRQPPMAMDNQLCFTNREMTAAFIAQVRKVLAEAPKEIDCLNIKVEDNWGVCCCPACLAPLQLPDGQTLPATAPAFRSTQFFQFLNTVAEAIQPEYPDLKFGTYAYFFTAIPPAIPLHPAIRAYFCPYIRNNDKYPIHTPVNQEWGKRLRAWSQASPNVTLREYYGIGTQFPRPLAEVAAWDLRDSIASGVVDFTSEINPDGGWLGKDYGTELIWDASMLDYWVITRLYWNPDANVEELRRHFLYRTFREGAPAMARYYGLLRKTWYQSPLISTCADRPLSSTRNYIVDTGIETELRGFLDEAGRAVQHPVAAKLIQAHRERFDAWLTEAHAMQLPEAAVPLRPEAVAEFAHPSWKNATLLEPFRALGNPQVTPRQATEVRLQYDAHNLYVFFRCLDSDPADIRAVRNDSAKERWTEGDHAEIFLADPADPGNYFQFCFDTLGNRYDLSARERDSWDGAWQVVTQVTPDSWEAIATIPLSTIGLNTARDPELGALFYREFSHGDRAEGEHSSWGGSNVCTRAEFRKLKFMR